MSTNGWHAKYFITSFTAKREDQDQSFEWDDELNFDSLKQVKKQTSMELLESLKKYSSLPVPTIPYPSPGV